MAGLSNISLSLPFFLTIIKCVAKNLNLYVAANIQVSPKSGTMGNIEVSTQ
jgi:hypothetical protein